MSGHIFFAHRWFGFDDGIYSSGRLLELVSRTDRPVSTLLADVPRTFSTPEIRYDCPEEMKFELVRRAQEWFAARHEAVTVDGVRVIFPDGWGLVRASNTQPLLVLRFEARTPERLAEIQSLDHRQGGRAEARAGRHGSESRRVAALLRAVNGDRVKTSADGESLTARQHRSHSVDDPPGGLRRRSRRHGIQPGASPAISGILRKKSAASSLQRRSAFANLHSS